MNEPTKDENELAETLFSDDRIWNATEDDLNTALKVTANRSSVDNHWIVRALVVLSIKQDRRIKMVEQRNWWISSMLLILTVVLVIETAWLIFKR